MVVSVHARVAADVSTAYAVRSRDLACGTSAAGRRIAVFRVFRTLRVRYMGCTMELEAHLGRSGTASWMFLRMVLVSSAVACVFKYP